MDSKDILNDNIPFVDVVKPIKGWGVNGGITETTGATRYVQSPTEEELEAAHLERGSQSTSYEYTTDNPEQLIAAFTSYPEAGQPCYEITLTEQEGTIWHGNVVKTILRVKIEGREGEDDVDYGTDGDGNIDYDDWTTQRKAKITDD